jgi:hypothetical protein
MEQDANWKRKVPLLMLMPNLQLSKQSVFPANISTLSFVASERKLIREN